MFIYVLQGVGKRVRIRELMGIASADENHDHVISVKNYKNHGHEISVKNYINLQNAINRVVYKKGTSNSMSFISFYLASKYSSEKNVPFAVPS